MPQHRCVSTDGLNSRLKPTSWVVNKQLSDKSNKIHCVQHKIHYTHTCNGSPIGGFATVRCKPRQDRKVATVAVVWCAEVKPVGLPPYYDSSSKSCCSSVTARKQIFKSNPLYCKNRTCFALIFASNTTSVPNFLHFKV